MQNQFFKCYFENFSENYDVNWSNFASIYVGEKILAFIEKNLENDLHKT